MENSFTRIACSPSSQVVSFHSRSLWHSEIIWYNYELILLLPQRFIQDMSIIYLSHKLWEVQVKVWQQGIWLIMVYYTCMLMIICITRLHMQCYLLWYGTYMTSYYTHNYVVMFLDSGCACPVCLPCAPALCGCPVQLPCAAARHMGRSAEWEWGVHVLWPLHTRTCARIRHVNIGIQRRALVRKAADDADVQCSLNQAA